MRFWWARHSDSRAHGPARSRRRQWAIGTLLLAGLAPVLLAPPARAAEVYLTEEEAPAAVFPDAVRFERREIVATAELRRRVGERLAPVKATVREARYPVWTAYGETERLGEAIVVEEIGKHRAITFVVGIDSAGEVAGVAVMAYREPYGSEVRSRRFLRQYEGKGADDPLIPARDIRNITGATLSARAIGRGVKKAIAVLALSPVPAEGPPPASAAAAAGGEKAR